MNRSNDETPNREWKKMIENHAAIFMAVIDSGIYKRVLPRFPPLNPVSREQLAGKGHRNQPSPPTPAMSLFASCVMHHPFP
jgi:hypothetical protein